MLFTRMTLKEHIDQEIGCELLKETNEDRRAVLMLQLLCDHDFKAVATGQICIDECTKCGRTYSY